MRRPGSQNADTVSSLFSVSTTDGEDYRPRVWTVIFGVCVGTVMGLVRLISSDFMHATSDIFTVSVYLVIFAVGWSSLNPNSFVIVMSSGFICSAIGGWLHFLQHTVVISNTYPTNTAVWLGTISNLNTAMTLWIATVILRNVTLKRWLYFLVHGACFTAVAMPALLGGVPILVDEATHALYPAAIALMVVVAVAMLVMGVLVLMWKGSFHSSDGRFLFALACFAMTLEDLFRALGYDIDTWAGDIEHVFKAVGSFWLLRLIVMKGIERPIEALRAGMRRKEADADRQLELSEALMQMAPVALAIVDEDGVIEKCNETLLAWLGIENAVGTSLFDRLASPELGPEFLALARSPSLGEQRWLRADLPNETGGLRQVEWRVSGSTVVGGGPRVSNTALNRLIDRMRGSVIIASRQLLLVVGFDVTLRNREEERRRYQMLRSVHEHYADRAVAAPMENAIELLRSFEASNEEQSDDVRQAANAVMAMIRDVGIGYDSFVPPGIEMDQLGPEFNVQRRIHVAVSRESVSTTTRSPVSGTPSPGMPRPSVTAGPRLSANDVCVEMATPNFVPHEPQEFMGKLRVVLTEVEKWDADAFMLSDHCDGMPLVYVGLALFHEHGLMRLFNISEDTLINFLAAIQAGYEDNPYHSMIHAIDVTISFNHFLSTGLSRCLTDLDVLAGLVAALVHDFRHPGLGNSFQVASGSDLAVLFNDVSVLENFHASSFFQLIHNEKFNILAGLTPPQYRHVRDMIVSMVLATDMAQHFAITFKFKSYLSAMSTSSPLPEDGLVLEDKKLVLMVALKAADIANPVKPVDVAVKWTARMIQEFHLQGDEERARGLDMTPATDRTQRCIVKGQCDFIDYVVMPLYEQWVAFLGPDADMYMATLKATREHWAGMDESSAQAIITGIQLDNVAAPPSSRFSHFIPDGVTLPDMLLGEIGRPLEVQRRGPGTAPSMRRQATLTGVRPAVVPLEPELESPQLPLRRTHSTGPSGSGESSRSSSRLVY